MAFDLDVAAVDGVGGLLRGVLDCLRGADDDDDVDDADDDWGRLSLLLSSDGGDGDRRRRRLLALAAPLLFVLILMFIVECDDGVGGVVTENDFDEPRMPRLPLIDVRWDGEGTTSASASTPAG